MELLALVKSGLTALADGISAALQMTPFRALHANLRDNSGNELGTIANPVNVTGGGGGAATIADGADVTQGAKADARSTATDATPVTVMQVLKELSFQAQNPASTPITGSISFTAPQHVIADSGTITGITNAIHAIIDSSSDIEAVQDTAADLNATVVFASPQHTIVDSGTVTGITNPIHAIIDSASDVEAVQDTAADLNATVVFASPQHVINDAGTAVIGHVIADTGSTTAVTGNVTAVQSTGTNLHVVTDSTSVTNATLSAETTKVIGTVNIASGQTVGLAAGTAEIGNVKNSGTFAVQLTAETTKVIGTVNIASGQAIAVAGQVAAGSPDTANPITIAANDALGNVDTLDAATVDSQSALLVSDPQLFRLLEQMLYEQRLANMLLLKLSEPFSSNGWPQIADPRQGVVQ